MEKLYLVRKTKRAYSSTCVTPLLLFFRTVDIASAFLGGALVKSDAKTSTKGRCRFEIIVGSPRVHLSTASAYDRARRCRRQHEVILHFFACGAYALDRKERSALAPNGCATVLFSSALFESLFHAHACS